MKLLEKDSQLKLSQLIQRLTEIRDFTLSSESKFSEAIDQIQPNYQRSARNLLHYMALRTFSLIDIQEQLSTLGISSLTHSEAYTLVNLENILTLLHLIIQDDSEIRERGLEMDYPKSKDRLRIHTNELFGEQQGENDNRIMVTMPTEASKDKKLIDKLLDAGMDCARINCGHDSLQEWKMMVKNIRKISKKKGMSCKIYMDLAGPKLRTGQIQESLKKKESKKKDSKKKKKKKNGILLMIGETLRVYKEDKLGRPAARSKKGKLKQIAFISTTLPAIFEDVKDGESIWFDDGKIGGEIENITSQYFDVNITHAGLNGSLLQASKGINLPDTDLTLPSLTKQDLDNLPFIVKYADIVGYSFVRSPKDIEALQKELKELKNEEIGIILKIETWDAFYNLPFLLLTAMKSPKIGVMIARGDLAIEAGWKRLSELQVEILWLCEAAHIPTVWATQVLDNLAKKGLATRSEITDAAMASRAECTMLNKGPYIVKAVTMLREITGRMNAHQQKKMDTLRPLGVAKEFFEKSQTVDL